MTWAQRLKRVFNIDIEVGSLCGGSVRVIACIEDQSVFNTHTAFTGLFRSGYADYLNVPMHGSHKKGVCPECADLSICLFFWKTMW